MSLRENVRQSLQDGTSSEEILSTIQRLYDQAVFGIKPVLSASNTTDFCGKVWGSGEVGYRCRTCQVSDTSCICVSCFNDGNHEGHDFSLYVSSFGGICDCGSADAWKPSGFCEKHCLQQPPSISLQESERFALMNVATGLAYFFVRLIDRGDFQALSAICSWIKSTFCENILLLELLGDAFLSEYPEGAEEITKYEFQDITMYILVHSLTVENAKIVDQVAILLLHLVSVKSYKAELAKRIVQVYSDFCLLLTRTVSKPPSYSLFDKITVQIFNIDSIVEELMAKYRFIDLLLNEQLKFYQRAAKPAYIITGIEPSSTRENLPPRIVSVDTIGKKYTRLNGDIYMVFALPRVLDYIQSNDAPLTTWTQTQSLLQYIHPQVRATLFHIEYESQAWKSTFAQEFENRHQIVTLLHDAPVAGLEKFISVACEILKKDLDKRNFTRAVPLREGLPASISFTVSSQPVSFHFPLHRAVSFALRRLVANIGFSSAFQNLTEQMDEVQESIMSEPFIELAMEDILRVLVLSCQISARVWAWNGYSMLHQNALYRASGIEALEDDFWWMQWCASCLPSTYFLTTVLSRFEAHELLQRTSPPEIDQRYMVCIEDMLVFLVSLLLGPSHPTSPSSPQDLAHWTDDDKMKYRVMHRLAVSSYTFSQLEDRISYRSDRVPHLRKILSEIADVRSPSADAPMVFSLPAARYASLDWYFSRWTKSDLHDAEAVKPIPLRVPILLSDDPKCAMLRHLRKYLDCPLLYVIVLSALVNHPTELTFTACIHLLKISLQRLDVHLTTMETKSRVDQYVDSVFALLPALPEPCTIVDISRMLVHLPDHHEPFSLLTLILSYISASLPSSTRSDALPSSSRPQVHTLHLQKHIADEATELLRDLSRKSALCFDSILEWEASHGRSIVGLSREDNSNITTTTDMGEEIRSSDAKARRRKLALERQNALMNEMKQQQAAFISSNVDANPNVCCLRLG